jgi:hypothetical protein
VSTVKFSILVFGGVCEFAGVILTAAPELYPRLTPIGEGIARLVSAARARVERIFGRPKAVSHSISVSGGATAGGHASGYASVSDAESVEGKLAFLIDQAVKTQRRFDALEGRVGNLPKLWKAEIDAAKGEIATLIGTKLAKERDAYIRSRLVGITLLAIGLPIVFIANFIE